jgi:hypothetical protein
MKAIEDAKSRLMASDLVQNPLTRTRNAHDIIDECLAPLAAELAAACEAIPVDAEKALLNYWWHHGCEIGGEMNSAPLATVVIRDLRLALTSRCPTNSSEHCKIDHSAALHAVGGNDGK